MDKSNEILRNPNWEEVDRAYNYLSQEIDDVDNYYWSKQMKRADMRKLLAHIENLRKLQNYLYQIHHQPASSA